MFFLSEYISKNLASTSAQLVFNQEGHTPRAAVGPSEAVPVIEPILLYVTEVRNHRLWLKLVTFGNVWIPTDLGTFPSWNQGTDVNSTSSTLEWPLGVKAGIDFGGFSPPVFRLTCLQGVVASVWTKPFLQRLKHPEKHRTGISLNTPNIVWTVCVLLADLSNKCSSCSWNLVWFTFVLTSCYWGCDRINSSRITSC